MQTTVALSSTEAEYISLSAGICECTWLMSLFDEIGIELKNVIIMEDNQSAMKLAELEKINDRSKHFDIKYRHVRETIREGKIFLKYVQTENQIADTMTKGLARSKFEELREKMGMCKSEDKMERSVKHSTSRGSVGLLMLQSDLNASRG